MRHLAIAAMTAALLASTSIAHAATAFTTIDNPGDPTFNQLLSINDSGVIAGYFGSGAAGHPNQAYLTAPPYTKFTPANVPGSVQTQVTGLNATGVLCGFWSDTDNGVGIDNNFGFIRIKDGAWFEWLDVNDPLVAGAPLVNQLLGINKADIAVGFYNDANGHSHGFSYNAVSGMLAPVKVSGSVSSAATAINDNNLVAGFFTDGKMVTHGFTGPLSGFSNPVKFTVPGASVTQLLGVNNKGIAVGFYQLSPTDVTHGIVYNPASGNWTQIDDPNGPGGTVVNGINNKGEAVGFYTDSAGNVNGMLITGLIAP
jgi:hypothetical protein